MTRKKAVKVRRWVTCAVVGCKRRAGVSSSHCGKHQKQYPLKKMKVVMKGKAQPKKPARQKSQKEITAAVKARTKAAALATYRKKKRAVRKKTRTRRAGKSAVKTLSRLIKAYCKKCEYTIRLSRKWIEVRRPHCPICLMDMITEIDDEKSDPRQLKLKGAMKTKAAMRDARAGRTTKIGKVNLSPTDALMADLHKEDKKRGVR